MAAFVRRARAGRGGHGRAEGRQRGPAVHDVPVLAAVPVPVPAQDDRLAPLHQQWAFWKAGNQNGSEPVDNDQSKMCRRLEQSPFIHKQELCIFAIPERLLNQPRNILTMLRCVVDFCNMMMDIRRRYLAKQLDGCNNKETEQMLKTLTKFVERVDDKIEAIKKAGVDCPGRPKVFDHLPKLLK